MPSSGREDSPEVVEALARARGLALEGGEIESLARRRRALSEEMERLERLLGPEVEPLPEVDLGG